MGFRGSVTLECDQKDCHAELVIGDLEFDVQPQRGGGLQIVVHAAEWREDDHGRLWCPECITGSLNERQKGDDDGREYGHPADARQERL